MSHPRRRRACDAPNKQACHAKHKEGCRWSSTLDACLPKVIYDGVGVIRAHSPLTERYLREFKLLKQAKPSAAWQVQSWGEMVKQARAAKMGFKSVDVVATFWAFITLTREVDTFNKENRREVEGAIANSASYLARYKHNYQKSWEQIRSNTTTLEQPQPQNWEDVESTKKFQKELEKSTEELINRDKQKLKAFAKEHKVESVAEAEGRVHARGMTKWSTPSWEVAAHTYAALSMGDLAYSASQRLLQFFARRRLLRVSNNAIDIISACVRFLFSAGNTFLTVSREAGKDAPYTSPVFLVLVAMYLARELVQRSKALRNMTITQLLIHLMKAMMQRLRKGLRKLQRKGKGRSGKT